MSNPKEQRPLIKRSHKEDLETFNILFDSHYAMLFNYILKLSNDSAVAKDVVQIAFIKLWEKRGSIDFNLSVKNYLFKICHNEFLQYIRKKKKEESMLDELKYSIAYQSYNQLDDEGSKKLQMERAIEKLPARVKEAFMLSRYEKLKYKEIALKMGISIKTVEKHLSTALKQIKANVKMLFL